ncbi:unnamed protein product [Sphenostylis stenocarpa]|uniref:Uncharacterized protein n=1 Tax=Sphenostylis stenocarpa TaxID=92480 RepID=A0AA86W4R6_9FABA|nr:unnamed protein product [Sphenostylis stenocarpa]
MEAGVMGMGDKEEERDLEDSGEVLKKDLIVNTSGHLVFRHIPMTRQQDIRNGSKKVQCSGMDLQEPQQLIEFRANFLGYILHTMGTRGVIGDKWSMRVLWACAIGSAVSLYMVAVERQAQNRQRILAEELRAMESGESNDNDG